MLETYKIARVAGAQNTAFTVVRLLDRTQLSVLLRGHVASLWRAALHDGSVDKGSHTSGSSISDKILHEKKHKKNTLGWIYGKLCKTI